MEGWQPLRPTGWLITREAEPFSTSRSIEHHGLAKPRPSLLQQEGTS